MKCGGTKRERPFFLQVKAQEMQLQQQYQEQHLQLQQQAQQQKASLEQQVGDYCLRCFVKQQKGFPGATGRGLHRSSRTAKNSYTSPYDDNGTLSS